MAFAGLLWFITSKIPAAVVIVNDYNVTRGP